MRKYSNEELAQAVKESLNIRQLLGKLGLKETGGNYKTVPERVKDLGLDISHFRTGKGIVSSGYKWRKLDEILVEGSNYQTFKLKNRLLKEGILKNECSSCGLLPIWNDKPLNMILDHKNGVHNDHRLENLRLLCPNCNSQMPTHCGKNKRHAVHENSRTSHVQGR